LGALELRRDGNPIDAPALRRARVRSLLHYLVARRSCRREELGVALWPDLDEQAMANNLRVNLSHVHHLLEPDRQPGEPSFFLEQSGDRVALRTGDGLDVDADRFEGLLALADAADAAGDPGLALQRHEAALGFYRGDYQADAADPDWGYAHRIRLRSGFVRSALRAAALRLGQRDFDRALAWIRRVLEVDDLAERAYRLRALVYLRREDRAAAHAALQKGLQMLAAAGLEPEPETMRIAKRLGVVGGRRASP
jgi:DNA-binding SARP family transcriptional activator